MKRKRKLLRDFRPAQLKSYRFFRDKGFTIPEAKRLACLTTSRMADELRAKLREVNR